MEGREVPAVPPGPRDARGFSMPTPGAAQACRPTSSRRRPGRRPVRRGGRGVDDDRGPGDAAAEGADGREPHRAGEEPAGEAVVAREVGEHEAHKDEEDAGGGEEEQHDAGREEECEAGGRGLPASS